MGAALLGNCIETVAQRNQLAPLERYQLPDRYVPDRPDISDECWATMASPVSSQTSDHNSGRACLEQKGVAVCMTSRHDNAFTVANVIN